MIVAPAALAHFLMPSLSLTYLDIPGRAEATRLAFAIGGIVFEDKRFSFAEFPAVRSRMPWHQVPVLEVGDRRARVINRVICCCTRLVYIKEFHVKIMATYGYKAST